MRIVCDCGEELDLIKAQNLANVKDETLTIELVIDEEDVVYTNVGIDCKACNTFLRLEDQME